MKLVTCREAAEIYDCTASRFHIWAREGVIQPVAGSGHRFDPHKYDLDEIARVLVHGKGRPRRRNPKLSPARIIDLLDLEGYATIQNLADWLDEKPETVRKALYRLRDNGEVGKVDEWWVLPGRVPPVGRWKGPKGSVRFPASVGWSGM